MREGKETVTECGYQVFHMLLMEDTVDFSLSCFVNFVENQSLEKVGFFLVLMFHVTAVHWSHAAFFCKTLWHVLTSGSVTTLASIFSWSLAVLVSELSFMC
jgi:hypothetical protein